MADKKKRNFKGMAEDELHKELDGLSKALHGLRTQTVTSTVENKSLFRSNRRDIARILTELRARELKSSSAKPPGDKSPSAKAPAPKAAEVKPPAAKAKGGKSTAGKS